MSKKYLTQYKHFPKFEGIVPPPGGWKSETYYRVMVSFSKRQPIFESIFYSGFLDYGNPTWHCRMFTHDYGTDVYGSIIEQIYYMCVVEELYQEIDFDAYSNSRVTWPAAPGSK